MEPHENENVPSGNGKRCRGKFYAESKFERLTAEKGETV